MTNDELATALRANFAELHAKVNALPSGSVKTRARMLARLAHAHLNELQELAAGEGEIEPFDGTNKPPEGE